MISNEQYEKILDGLPFLRGADPNLVRDFKDTVFLASIPAGKDVFVEGDYPELIALVISGMVRVYKIGQTGREITLYRFGLGESCILTANAILSQKSFPAIATVESDIQAVMIPGDAFRHQDDCRFFERHPRHLHHMNGNHLIADLTSFNELQDLLNRAVSESEDLRM